MVKLSSFYFSYSVQLFKVNFSFTLSSKPWNFLHVFRSVVISLVSIFLHFPENFDRIWSTTGTILQSIRTLTSLYPLTTWWTRTNRSTSSWRWLARTPTKSTSGSRWPPSWASWRSLTLRGPGSRPRPFASSSTAAVSTTTRRRRPSRWSRTTSSKSIRSKPEAAIKPESYVRMNPEQILHPH